LEDISVIVENLSKKFKMEKPGGLLNSMRYLSQPKKEKAFMALDDVSFKVRKGELLGIIGLNGSGKTTLLRVIAGVYTPDGGRLKINGKLSPLLHLGTGFQAELTAKDNIIMNGMLLGLSKFHIEAKVESIIQYAELEKFSKMKLKHYSTGMRARLAFSTAMEINPDILLVDEILAVGDKDFKEKSYEKFMTFKKNKKTILYVTHNTSKLKEIADRVLLLHKGKKVVLGEPEPVIKRYHHTSLPK